MNKLIKNERPWSKCQIAYCFRHVKYIIMGWWRRLWSWERVCINTTRTSRASCSLVKRWYRALYWLHCVVGGSCARSKTLIFSPQALKIINICQERIGVRVYLKLRAWEVTEYEQVCLLDLDMLVRQSMDPVFASRSPVAGVFRGSRDLFRPWEERPARTYFDVDKFRFGTNGGLIVLFSDPDATVKMIDEIDGMARSHGSHYQFFRKMLSSGAGAEQNPLSFFWRGHIQGIDPATTFKRIRLDWAERTQMREVSGSGWSKMQMTYAISIILLTRSLPTICYTWRMTCAMYPFRVCIMLATRFLKSTWRDICIRTSPGWFQNGIDGRLPIIRNMLSYVFFNMKFSNSTSSDTNLSMSNLPILI